MPATPPAAPAAGNISVVGITAFHQEWLTSTQESALYLLDVRLLVQFVAAHIPGAWERVKVASGTCLGDARLRPPAPAVVTRGMTAPVVSAWGGRRT